MKMGRWVVDGHIHCGKKDHKAPGTDGAAPAGELNLATFAGGEVVGVDSSAWALYDMDAYGIDMGILLPSFTGTTKELYGDMVKKNPARLRSCVMDTTQRIKAARGEKEWTIKAAIQEIDEALTAEPEVFVGIGEFAPGCMGTIRKPPTYEQRCYEWSAIAECAIKHDVIVHFHEYGGYGQMLTGIRPSDAYDVLGMTCASYPELKVLINHGGGQSENEVREAVQFASSFPNVYLETGYWKAEFYEMAIWDQNVTCKRLIWGGGDTGSRIWMHHALRPAARLLNEHQVFYNRTCWPTDSTPTELPYAPDWYGWATHQIHRLKDMNLATQDQINLIVGGNAARVYKLPTPMPMDEMFAHGRPDLYIR
jgi:predicted TIM-barrel fold metal-dependent hydrolase